MPRWADCRRDLGGEFCVRVCTAALQPERAAQRVEPAFGDLASFVENRFLKTRQPSLDQSNDERPESCDLQQLISLRGNCGAARDCIFRHSERNDLDGRDHLSRFNHRVRRQGAEGHGFVDQIELVEAVAVKNQQAFGIGKQVGAAGEGGGGRDPRPSDGGGHAVGRRVLADIARFEANDGDLLDPGAGDCRDIGGGKDAAFLQHGRAKPQAVDEDCAFGLLGRDLAEMHSGP